MTRRGKIVLAVLVVGSTLGLVAATNAWFVAVSNTPPGAVNSALVRWLPEAGERSFSSILTYGNLISGSGVDPDGMPLVLPGNSLLANVASDGTTSTVRTSIARAFDDGPNHVAPETVDTVIHWEVKEYTRDDGSTVELIQKRRDVMDAQEPVDKWFNEAEPEKPIDNPTPNISDYTVTTTTSGGVGETSPDGKTTTTTTVVTTTYTALKAEAPSYRHIVTTTKVVTHEGATITPTEYAPYWNDASPVLSALETVLWVRDTEKAELADLPTRSYLIITPQSKFDGAAIPLALGNLSTTTSCVRVGLNARLTTIVDKVPTTTLLMLKEHEGTYYLGTTALGADKKEHFIELIAFRPFTEAGKYTWAAVADDTAAPWALWDLTVGSEDTATTTIPAPEPTPTSYTLTDSLGIVSKPSGMDSAFQGTAGSAEFEKLFNQLYCDNVPTITLHLSYYVRQSEFMEWSEFYSQDITFENPLP